VHAINERISKARQRRSGAPLSHKARLAIALILLVGCMLLADRFGLVALIANGYRALAYIMLAVFVLPLSTIGVARIRARWRVQNSSQSEGEDHAGSPA
jgi:uncharacterized membrane protein YkvI